MNLGYAYQYLLLLFVGMATVVGLPLPFSVPPLPEEPALSRVAPADSMMLLSWNGVAAIDPDSSNHAERLAAEPEVRAMFEQFQARLMRTIADNSPAAATGIAQRSVDLLVTMLQQPACVFLHDLQFAPKFAVSAGLAVKLDRHMTKAKALLGVLELGLGAQLRGDRHEDIEVDDVRFRALPIAQEYPFLGWAELDGWFLLAVGEDTPAQMVAGLLGSDQGLAGDPAFARLRQDTAVARPALRTFVNLRRVCAHVGGAGGRRLLDVLGALGVGKATAAMSTTGLEGDGACYRARLLTPVRDGLLAAFDGAPLAQDELLHIPADSDLSLSARVDAVRLEQALLEVTVAMGDPQAAQMYEREVVEGFTEHFGIRWREDLLALIGDQVTCWNAPSQGGALFTSLTATCPLRDGARAKESLQTFADKVHEQPHTSKAKDGAELGRNRAYLEPLVVGEHRGWWIDVLDDDVFIAPAWLATGDRFFCSLMPQPVRAAVAAAAVPNPDRSIARLPQVNRRGKATAMLQLDLQGLLRNAWPLLGLGVKMGSADWQRDGLPFDTAMLPSPTAVLPHLGQEVTLLEPVEDGWALTRTGRVALLDPMTVIVVTALLGTLGENL